MHPLRQPRRHHGLHGIGYSYERPLTSPSLGTLIHLKKCQLCYDSAVFYGGVALGGVLATTKPRTGPQWLRVAFGLASASACMWACAWGMETALGLRVSRRLVNAPYVVWTLAYNTTALSLFLLLEMALHFAKGSIASSVLAWRAADKGRHCEILCDAINRNQLFIFLLSNRARHPTHASTDFTLLCSLALSSRISASTISLSPYS